MTSSRPSSEGADRGRLQAAREDLPLRCGRTGPGDADAPRPNPSPRKSRRSRRPSRRRSPRSRRHLRPKRRTGVAANPPSGTAQGRSDGRRSAQEAFELLLELAEPAAAVDQLLVAAGPGRMGVRIDVEIAAWRLRSRRSNRSRRTRTVRHHDVDLVVIGVNVLSSWPVAFRLASARAAYDPPDASKPWEFRSIPSYIAARPRTDKTRAYLPLSRGRAA